ncbi:MAG: TonB-dependent receptor, partial [Cyanobacteria bacterium P01_H01_bin.119]
MNSSRQTLFTLQTLAVMAGVFGAVFPAHGETTDRAVQPAGSGEPLLSQAPSAQPQGNAENLQMPAEDTGNSEGSAVLPMTVPPRTPVEQPALSPSAPASDASTEVISEPSEADGGMFRSDRSAETWLNQGAIASESEVNLDTTIDLSTLGSDGSFRQPVLAQFDGSTVEPMVEFQPTPLRPDAPDDPLERLSEEIFIEENPGPSLEFAPVGSGLAPANGRAVIRLQGRILDVDGEVLDRDVVVTLTSSAGEFVEADYDSDRAGFQILARRGEFETLLRSTLDAQTVQLRAAVDGHLVRGLDPAVDTDPYPEVAAYTEVRFITNLRPSLVSGVVNLRLGQAGTNFWGRFSDFLNPELIDNGIELDPDIALFGIGTLGDWQITGAYTSERALNERCDGTGLYRDIQACEQTYPVYGDSSTTDYLTPSADSLYLRLQRDSILPGAEPDYFMWGDYDTVEFARASQTFTAATLQLHGFKGNYSFANGLQVTALFANNLQQLQRDTIVPDGTSGFYFLSRRAVLRGSENVFIETEEINRPGTVLERTEVFRGADYDIDYDRGTLLFRQPVYATEIDPFGQTVVRRIVVTYQLDGGEFGGHLYAGRVQYALTPTRDGWIGATFLSADQGDFDSNIYGVDLQLPLGSIGTLTGELAGSSATSGGNTSSGSAFRLAFNGNILPNIFGRAYVQTASTGFQNNYTSSFRPGQTRWGAEVAARIGATTLIRGRVDQETNVGTAPAVLTSAAALLEPGTTAAPGSAVDNSLGTLQVGVQQQFG